MLISGSARDTERVDVQRKRTGLTRIPTRLDPRLPLGLVFARKSTFQATRAACVTRLPVSPREPCRAPLSLVLKREDHQHDRSPPSPAPLRHLNAQIRQQDPPVWINGCISRRTEGRSIFTQASPQLDSEMKEEEEKKKGPPQHIASSRRNHYVARFNPVFSYL